MTNRLGLTTVFVVLALVVAAVPAGALPAATTSAPAAQNGSNTSNATFGASVSAFMQASAANAEGEVEDGMFTARFENASEDRRPDIVRGRAANLEQRLERLRAERAELLNTTDGEEPSVADRAKAARLSARIDALENSIDTTSMAAERAGVDVTRLAELRASASELTGKEVAELARGLAGTGGPPEDAATRGGNGIPGGPDADGSEADGNTTDASESSGPDTGGSNGNNAGGPGDGADRSNARNDGSGTDDTSGAGSEA
ncbi:hypothetical protein [Halorarius litoreus]|uniref:hypothetical protein n=1 Tax=Halorarius litoreus TaxID=2962676 RepID=UPI0020CC4D9D|nr:hypothetical protein [Halorarius litoreus]